MPTISELPDCIEDYLRYGSETRNLSAATVAAYRSDLREIHRWFSRHRNCTLLNALQTDFRAFVAERVQQGTPPATIARRTSSYRMFCDWAVKTGCRNYHPLEKLKNPAVKQPTPTMLTAEEIETLMSSVDVSSTLGLRDRAMLELMYTTGLKLTEAVNLGLAQLGIDHRTVRIPSRCRLDRTLEIDERARNWLLRYLAEARKKLLVSRESEFVFVTKQGGTSLTRAAVWQRVKNCARNAGLPAVSPNTLRHSFAAHRVRKGITDHELRQQLGLRGHGSRLTANLYRTAAE